MTLTTGHDNGKGRILDHQEAEAAAGTILGEQSFAGSLAQGAEDFAAGSGRTVVVREIPGEPPLPNASTFPNGTESDSGGKEKR